MPTLGGSESSGDNSYLTSYFASAIAVDAPSKGPNDLYVTPIVPDATQFVGGSEATGPSLRDLTEGQDWLLKRIVGKLHCAPLQNDYGGVSTPNSPAFIKVAAAFFVARADENSPDVPDVIEVEEIDPLGTKNVRQPWIWRRNWILMNGLQSAPMVEGPRPIVEVNNQGFSVADGPHIDSKVARRIRREERLWFVINAYGYDDFVGTQSSYTNPGTLQFSLDYRILGAMRRSTNRSTF